MHFEDSCAQSLGCRRFFQEDFSSFYRLRADQMRIPLTRFKIGHVVEALCWTGKGDHQRADTALVKADAYLRPFLSPLLFTAPELPRRYFDGDVSLVRFLE